MFSCLNSTGNEGKSEVDSYCTRTEEVIFCTLYPTLGVRTGMGMYFITAFMAYCNYLEMIKAQFLIGQDFLGFDVIKKLKTSYQETDPHPPNVKMLYRTKLIYESQGGLPSKGRYGCAASAKLRPGKISPKNLMPRQKSAQKPNDRASFHDFESAKIENFDQAGHFFTLLSIITHFLVKNCQKPNAWAKFTS